MSDDKQKPVTKPAAPTQKPAETPKAAAPVVPKVAGAEAPKATEMTRAEGKERVAKLKHSTADRMYDFWTSNGVSPKEAVRKCIQQFGPKDQLAGAKKK